MSIRRASIEAKKSQHEQHRVGAVIVKGNRILSTGFNSMKSSHILKTNTRHAEGAAVLKLLKENRLHDLAGADIYVSRFTRGGRVGMAKPCDNCMALLLSVGVRRIFYTSVQGITMSETL